MKKIVILAAFLLAAGLAAQNASRILPAQGTYYSPTDIFFNIPPQMTLFYSFDSAAYDIKANGTITLDPGTGRVGTYKIFYQIVTAQGLIAEKSDMTWVIDRRHKPLIKTTIAPGLYNEDIEFGFLYTQDNPVYYAISQGGADSFKLWNKEKIRLSGKNEQVTSYKVLVYSGLNEGSAPAISAFYFTIDKKNGSTSSSNLKIISPVEGTFLNRQYLVLESTGFDWIKYSINSPVKDDSTKYSLPVEISTSGTVTVNIQGSRKGTGEIINKSVKYTVTSSATSSGKQGLFVSDQSVYNEGKSYSFDDSGIYMPFLAPIILTAVSGSRQDYILSVKSSENASTSERYWFSIDKRSSITPSITTEYTGSQTKIVISSYDGGTVYYSLDGKTPSVSSALYNGPIALPNSNGTALVRAISVLNERSISKEASYYVEIKGKTLDKPTVTWDPVKSTFTLSAANSDYVLFTYSEKTPPEVPGLNSPYIEFANRSESKTIINQTMLPVPVPYGMEKTVIYRFCSMDKSGNISEPTDAFTVKIDKKPPVSVKFSFTNEGVALSGEGSIYYMISDKPAVSYGSGWQKYTSKLKIDKSGLILSAYSIDENSNYSDITSVFTSVSGTVAITPFSISGIENGGITNKPEVFLTCPPVLKNLYYVYSLTMDGKEPPDPDAQSALLTEDTAFRCPDQQSLTFKVKIRLIHKITQELGAVQSISFTIDRIPPAEPFFEGIKNNGLYNNSVTIKLTSQEGNQVKCLISEKADPSADPALWMNYEKPITVDVDEQNEKTFYLHAYAMDKAGNTSFISAPVFTIDRKAPASECLISVSQVIYSGSDIVLPLKNDPGLAGIQYSLTKKTSTGSTVIDGTTTQSLSLTGEAGELTTYEAFIHAYDSAGNINLNPGIYSVVIDKREIEISKPVVQSVFNNLWLFSWNVPMDSQGRVKITNFDSSEETVEYRVPFFISNEKLRTNINISAILVGKDGREEIVKEFNLSPEVSTDQYRISGIGEGSVSNKSVSIVSENFVNTLRYSLSPDTTGIAVGTGSDILPSTLWVDLPFGKSSNYTLSVGVFDPSGKQIGQTDSYRFAIDKNPPAPPIVTGIADNEYYSSDINFSLHASEGTIYYTIIKDSYPSELLEDSSYEIYNGPVTLPYNTDTLFSYTISAYTADEAGNKCARNSVWTVYLDRDMIYVDNTVFDEGDGTRLKPLKSIPSALNLQKKNGKRIIFLMPGEYQLTDTLTLPDNVYLSAKVTSSQKIPSAIIRASKDFPAGKPLVISGKESRISNIIFQGSPKKESSLVSIVGTSVSLENCRFILPDDRTAAALFGDNSDVKILACVLESKNNGSDKIFDCNDSDIKISSSLIEIGSTSKNFSLISSKNGRSLEIVNSKINITYGNELSLSTSDYASLIFKNNRLSVSGVQNSFTAFRGNISNLEFTNNTVETDSTVWLSTILEITGAKAKILSNNILMKDQLGFMGFNLLSCDFVLSKNNLVSQTKGFAYFLKSSSSKGQIVNNSVLISKARDFSAVIGNANSLVIMHNFINAVDVSTSLIYMDMENSNDTFIAANFFESSGKTKESYLVKSDSFTGFNFVSNYVSGSMVWFFQQKKNIKIKTARDLNGHSMFIGSGEVKGNADNSSSFAGKDGLLTVSNKNNVELYPVLQDETIQKIIEEKTGLHLKKAAGLYVE